MSLDRTQKRWTITIVLAAVIIIGSFYSDWRKHTVPDPAPTGQKEESPQAEAVIYVSGGVNKPGVYKIAFGSRVTDAVAAAGGLVEGAETTKLNLAQFVKDGMHIYVPVRTATAAHRVASPAPRAELPAPAALPNKASPDKISINTADAGQLEQLPGIGPVLAGRIIEYRRAHGLFRDLAELKLVPGIGDVKFNQLKDKITL